MDAKVFRTAILTIISAFLLILIIVYATNADKINKMLGGEKKSAVVEEVAEETLEDPEEETFGDQIGDNLNGFINDESFFDETEKIPSVVVRQKVGSEDEDDAEALDDGTEGDVPSAEDSTKTPGKAVVGELTNPDEPIAGVNTYIPPEQTVTGTPVGN